MIKANIKTDVLKETRNKLDLGMHIIVDVDGPKVILEEELYKLLKEFEKQIPEVWANALERVIDDTLMDDFLEGEDEE
jgi:hypothetical protein